ncbi:MAG: AarF/UbiB family protein, partial [Pseudomonadota bacterium]
MSTISSMLALARAGFVLAREGVISELPDDLLPGPGRFAKKAAALIAKKGVASSARADRLSAALNRLGPSWVKLGQFLATRPDVVGKHLAHDLENLQDRMQPFALEEARQSISGSLGVPVDTVFDNLGEAVAAASVAQVHKAVRKSDGAEVAIKVIRPGVRNRFRSDLNTFYAAAQFQEQHLPATRRLRPVAVVDMLAQSAKIEMDLRLEAAAFSELRANTIEDEGFKVPGVDWVLT